MAFKKIKSFIQKRVSPETYWKLGSIRQEIFGHSRKTYSQFGEDIYLETLFQNQNQGTYLDIGAHHPCRLSNTYLLYQRGWHGVNIDPIPGMKKRFDKKRPRDINLEMGVSEKKGILTYYQFNEPACNTFSEDVAKERDGKSGQRIVGKRLIPTDRLETILKKHFPQKPPDLVSIDVEGMDLQILRSPFIKKKKPRVLCVEDHTFDPGKPTKSVVYALLTSPAYSYRLIAWIGPTLIFLKKPFDLPG